MADERMISELSGRTLGRVPHDTVPVIEADGAPLAAGVDEEGVLHTCDLRSGARTEVPLDLDPQTLVGPLLRGEEDEEDEEFEEEDLSEYEIDTYKIAARAAALHLGGRPVLLTGADRFDVLLSDDDYGGGAVRAWDLRTGRMVGRPMDGHELGVTALTALAGPGTALSVSSSEEGRLVVWDLDRGERVANLAGSYNGVMGAGFAGGRPIAATGGHDDFAEAWDLAAGERIGGPLTGIDAPVSALAVAEVEGRAVVLAAAGAGTDLYRWGPAGGVPAGAPLTGHTDQVVYLATAVVGGRPIAVSGAADRTVRVWDLAGGEQIGAPIEGCWSLEDVTAIAGAPVAVTSTPEGELQVWDLERAAG
ncbi:WD40 repeat domain-containing protein [Nocardiopsis potens]|uniref:WD40 repeat domain-containing protein n=1 Tax=Nocardiopsis potens TaxID=1246458 RepID=UPI000345541A|nr:hypothetical protein [Nocardiopsis potens]